MPILTGIKFEVTDDDLLVATATDLEIGIKYSMPVKVFEPGVAILPSKYIIDLIRLLPDLPIVFKDDPQNSNITVKYGESETAINCYPTEEYPGLEFPDNENSFTIKESVLENTLKQIIFAIASSDTRTAALTGAMFTVNKKQVEIVSTDLHRLTWCILPIENSDIGNKTIIIPGKTLGEINRIIGKNDNNIRVSINENQVLFYFDKVSIISRLMNGQFPKFKHVIPEKHTTRIRVKTKEFLEATERASLLGKEEKSSIKLVINDGLMVISDTTVAGQIYEEISVELDGESTKIGFNAFYLIDLLRIIKSEEIEIDLAGSFSPGVFKPIGEKDNFSLILPVRIEV